MPTSDASPVNTVAQRELAKLANLLAWKSPDLSIPRPIEGHNFVFLVNELQRLMAKSHADGRLVLPDLTAFSNQTVGLFSDYSGEGSGAFHAYSTVVCGYDFVGQFAAEVAKVRQEHGLGEKEIAYKDLRMGQMRRAMPQYLKAADNLLPGFLLSILIDKRLVSVIGPKADAIKGEFVRVLSENGFGGFSKKGAEKVLRVVHTVAYLAALLTRDGQKIFWMSDNDEICPNPEAHQLILKLFQGILYTYCPKGTTFALVGGATPFKEKDLTFLDVLSLADVVAGSLHEYMTQRQTREDDAIQIKHGADEALRWLAHDGIGMKKRTFVFRKGEGDEVLVGEVLITLKEAQPGVTYLPIFIGRSEQPDVPGLP